jgi:hypothetical protein
MRHLQKNVTQKSEGKSTLGKPKNRGKCIIKMRFQKGMSA